jgi:hypothetical protein
MLCEAIFNVLDLIPYPVLIMPDNKNLWMNNKANELIYPTDDKI